MPMPLHLPIVLPSAASSTSVRTVKSGDGLNSVWYFSKNDRSNWQLCDDAYNGKSYITQTFPFPYPE